MPFQRIIAVCAVVLSLVAVAPASKRGVSKERADQREKLETAVAEYKTSLETLIESLEREVERRNEALEKRRELVAAGLVARREVETSETDLAKAKADLAKANKELEEADQLLNEALWMEKLAVVPPSRSGAYRATGAVIRYGGGRWAIQDINKVQGFFASRFGRNLPISAFGQSAVHDRLGFDHSNAVDLPIHPDSAEGQAVIAYLRSAGIPFLAFRGAIPGKSTGAHIHIGRPSSRLWR